jgi:hypothetical protein
VQRPEVEVGVSAAVVVAGAEAVEQRSLVKVGPALVWVGCESWQEIVGQRLSMTAAAALQAG